MMIIIIIILIIIIMIIITIIIIIIIITTLIIIIITAIIIITTLIIIIITTIIIIITTLIIIIITAIIIITTLIIIIITTIIIIITTLIIIIIIVNSDVPRVLHQLRFELMEKHHLDRFFFRHARQNSTLSARNVFTAGPTTRAGLPIRTKRKNRTPPDRRGTYPRVSNGHEGRKLKLPSKDGSSKSLPSSFFKIPRN